ncbi:MAG: aspartate/glutamate racemase family protein [Pseudomonadota bacterium]
MSVVLINPNSTEAMTQSALQAARRAAPDVDFEGWTSSLGPAAIEGAEDGARAVPPLLDLVVRASSEGAEAIIIACFDDTGLAEARAIARCPVIGIGQSSFVLAALQPGAAAVITTVDAAVPVIQQNIEAQGFSAAVTQVLAARVPVLDLEIDPDAAAEAFCRVAGDLDEHISTIILGCAGAVTISTRVEAAMPHKVLDGVTSAARLIRAVVT